MNPYDRDWYATHGYWMVHCPDHGMPRVMHKGYDTAKLEAERLAAENPGRSFYVLAAVEVHQVKSIRSSQLLDPQPDDGIPF